MHIKPKKRLGQNFLIDTNIQRKIIAACELKASDIVLEIGAGRGELTRLIAERASEVWAVEIDYYLCQTLKEKFKNYQNVEIINQDILKFNLKRRGIKVIGNIPYYITTPIIEHLLKFKDKIDCIYISVQKEFARRMVAQAGSKDYGSFSCFVQYYTEPKTIFLIKKTSFLPTPKVDSFFLKLDIRHRTILEPENEKLLFKIIRSAFQQRRKTLRNSLNGIILPEKLRLFFRKYNIYPNIRPEDLTCQDFVNLSRIQLYGM